jgi:transposase, IS5 family
VGTCRIGRYLGSCSCPGSGSTSSPPAKCGPHLGVVPHPTTLMKLTTRCGSAAIDRLNEALLARAVETKLLRTTRVRVDTTVIPANVAYPTDSSCWRRRSDASRRPGDVSRPRAVRRARGCGTVPVGGPTSARDRVEAGVAAGKDEAYAAVRR